VLEEPQANDEFIHVEKSTREY